MHLRSHRCRRGCELSRGQHPNNGSITGTEHILGVHKQPSVNGMLLNNHVLWTYLVRYVSPDSYEGPVGILRSTLPQ